MPDLHPPVVTYLKQLELAVKRGGWADPEAVLSDAREHLQAEADRFAHEGPELTDEEMLERLIEELGSPEEVAREHRGHHPLPPKSGHAPGWRISCASCGRSLPLDRVSGAFGIGAHRVGGYSIGQRKMIDCSNCGVLRVGKLTRDLDDTNITDRLSGNRPAIRRRWLHNVRFVLILVGSIVAFNLALLAGVRLINANLPGTAMLANQAIGAPQSWERLRVTRVPRQTLNQFEQTLGGKIRAADNIVYRTPFGHVQVNTVIAEDEASAERIAAAIGTGKPRLVRRVGDAVTELVGRDARVLALARRELGFTPDPGVYTVQFDAVPLAPGADHTVFQELSATLASGAVARTLAEALERMPTDMDLRLASPGDTTWTAVPPAERSMIEHGRTTLTWETIPDRRGLPIVRLVGRLRTGDGTGGKLAESDAALTGPTAHWPVDQPAIRALAEEITAGATTDRERVQRILDWCVPGAQLRFSRGIGTRQGVAQTIELGSGRCWDFSDLFITLCRSAGVPARQIAGWLVEDEGHVWSEVALDGRWIQTDPTVGLLGVDGGYLGYITADDGDFPFVYASWPRIERAPDAP